MVLPDRFDFRPAAAEWLTWRLADGCPALAVDVREDGLKVGLTIDMIDRAAEDMRAGGPQQPTWRLPDDVLELLANAGGR
jgi:hypothetical protein